MTDQPGGGGPADGPRDETPPINGEHRLVAGRQCIFFEGYWIRYYEPPEDTLAARKRLIDSLTRRLFHHTEGGINTPGERLDLAREAHEHETDPTRKRVNAAMLAGALFNRATDIFTSVVDLAAKGVHISQDNELMRSCEEYFQEALKLGTQVKHYSGEEGIDELWGEPLKAFVLPVAEFYDTRYLKIAQAMYDIDAIALEIAEVFGAQPPYRGIGPRVRDLAAAARLETETMRSDPDIFNIWPRFVAAGEAVVAFEPSMPAAADDGQRRAIREGRRLLRDGRDLIGYLAGARVPMPKSKRQFLDRLADYGGAYR